MLVESGRMFGRRQDKMAFFEQEDFDLEQFADVHMINLTEKGIGTLKGELAALQDKCETEVIQGLQDLSLERVCSLL